METGLFDLYEIENGVFKLSAPSQRVAGGKRKPVKEYFASQGRFKSLDPALVEQIQQQVDAKWATLAAQAA